MNWVKQTQDFIGSVPAFDDFEDPRWPISGNDQTHRWSHSLSSQLGNNCTLSDDCYQVDDDPDPPSSPSLLNHVGEEEIPT